MRKIQKKDARDLYGQDHNMLKNEREANVYRF